MTKTILFLTFFTAFSSLAATCDHLEDRQEIGACIVEENKNFFSQIKRDSPDFKFSDITDRCGYDSTLKTNVCDGAVECLIVPVNENQVRELNSTYKNITVSGYSVVFEKYKKFCWD